MRHPPSSAAADHGAQAWSAKVSMAFIPNGRCRHQLLEERTGAAMEMLLRFETCGRV